MTRPAALICIKSAAARISHVFSMSSRERPKLRHCPICGIAMQASKSREGLAHFDRYECLSCHTVISETKTPPKKNERDKR